MEENLTRSVSARSASILTVAMLLVFVAIPVILLSGCGDVPITAATEPGAVAGEANSAADSDAANPEAFKTADGNPFEKDSAAASSGYMTFVINVHDTIHTGESADTILRLIGIFEKYGVHGDFYLTAPVVERYAAERPDVIDRLRESSMTISYHVRPPHPLNNGFDAALKDLDDAALASTLRDYETYMLDLESGGLNRDEPGGYAYVAQTFGRNPVTAGAPNNDIRIKDAAETGYAQFGARMTVRYHEEGTDLNQPFEWFNGLLARPSDFSITRWGEPVKSGGKDPFWWNMLSSSKAAAYMPTTYLQAQLTAWREKTASRPPFVTSLIHENNFYRSGAEAWTLSYFSDVGKEKPLKPPYDLNAPDASKPRSAAEQEAIWGAYEQMVAWTAANMDVVTSADIVAMAEAGA